MDEIQLVPSVIPDGLICRSVAVMVFVNVSEEPPVIRMVAILHLFHQGKRPVHMSTKRTGRV